MLRQYRFVTGGEILGIPAGKLAPGETPEDWAARELLEETGYRAERLISLGSISPNPALFANRCHMEVAENCEAVAPIQNSATEETTVELLPLSRLSETLRSGEIDHALVVPRAKVVLPSLSRVGGVPGGTGSHAQSLSPLRTS